MYKDKLQNLADSPSVNGATESLHLITYRTVSTLIILAEVKSLLKACNPTLHVFVDRSNCTSPSGICLKMLTQMFLHEK